MSSFQTLSVVVEKWTCKCQSSNGVSASHWVRISTTPIWVNRVICRYTGFTPKAFLKQYKPVLFVLCIRDSRFSFSKSSHTPSFIGEVSSNKHWCTILYFFQFILESSALWVTNWRTWSRFGSPIPRMPLRSVCSSTNVTDIFVPSQIMSKCDDKVFDTLHILKHSSLQGICGMNHFDPFHHK